MPTTININKKSDQLVGNIVITRTVCGNFDIGDNVKHAFQITLQSDNLLKSASEQKILLKQAIKNLIKDFKKEKTTSSDISSNWNEIYTENI